MTFANKLFSILTTKFGVVSFVAAWLGTFTLLFLYTERYLIIDVATGAFPLDLFLKILPSVLGSFLFRGASLLPFHYLLIVTLFSIYLTLILYTFVYKKYFSLTSFSVSLLSVLGISIGVTCLSCSAIAGVLLLSIFGVITSSSFILHSSIWFLVSSEILLILSIWLALRTILTLERN